MALAAARLNLMATLTLNVALLRRLDRCARGDGELIDDSPDQRGS